jgi:hypothetical protein
VVPLTAASDSPLTTTAVSTSGLTIKSAAVPTPYPYDDRREIHPTVTRTITCYALADYVLREVHIPMPTAADNDRRDIHLRSAMAVLDVHLPDPDGFCAGCQDQWQRLVPHSGCTQFTWAHGVMDEWYRRDAHQQRSG